MSVRCAGIAALLVLGLITGVLSQDQLRVRRQVVFPEDDDNGGPGFGNPSGEEEDALSRCRAPNGEKGKCIKYDLCTGVFNGRPNFSVLRRYLCGFSGEVPKVCCPDSRSRTPPPPTRRINPPPTPTRRPVPPPTPSTSEKVSSQPFKQTNRPTQLPIDCGRASARPIVTKIIGGNESNIGAWPWMAALFYEDQGTKAAECGGSLVSNRHVITAAHCIVDDNGNAIPIKDITARLGDHDIYSSNDETEPVDIEVTRIVKHPRFDRKTYHNDIAILVLKSEVQFNKFVQPICLAYDPPMLTDNNEGKRAYVAGWGTTSYNGQGSSKLREVYIPIWNQKRCREAYRNYIPVNEDYMCAGSADGGKDACQGDSGGPLMLAGGPETRYHLVGVVSFGKQCGIKDFPGVYTNVKNYLEWIRENIV